MIENQQTEIANKI